MRIIFLAMIFTIAFAALQGQDAELDSLVTALGKHPQPDTVRLKMLHTIAYAFNEYDPPKGITFADEQINLAKQLQQPVAEGKGYFNKGINYWAHGAFKKALDSYGEAVIIFEREGDIKKLANVNNSMAVVYQNLSDYPRALDVYLKNLQLFENTKDSFMMALTYGNIGIIYKYLKQPNKAIESYKKAIALNIKTDHQKELSGNYSNLGNIYDDNKEPAKAISYYQQALRISEPIHYTKNIAGNFSNIGIAYTTMGNYTAAYSHLTKALPLYIEMEDTKNIAVVLKSVGDIFITAPPAFFTSAKLNQGNRFDYAQRYFDSSLRLFTAMEDIAGQSEVWEKLADVYEKQHNNGAALNAYKKYTLLKDSILNDEKNTAITRLEMNYAFDKKEDSLTAANDKTALIAAAQIRRQRTIQQGIGIGSAILLLAALTSFMFYKKNRDASQKQVEAEFKTTVADTEMKALRAQMNPHFIFNSLNSISDYITKNDIPQADLYLGKFSKLMRMILENAEQKEIPVAADLKALELYMQLEALRLKNKFTYEIKVDDAIDQETTLVPPLILQPFVENSIWHGIAKKEGIGKILIRIEKDGDMINCIVEDNGVGRAHAAMLTTPGTNAGKSSLGMKITRARIDIINKVKNTKALVELSDLKEGLRVQVTLPLELSF